MIENMRMDDKRPKCVFADNVRYHVSSEHGKTMEKIKCPFCGTFTYAYTWSLSGSGKKCDVCKDTLHTTIYSVKRFKTAEEASEFYVNN